FLSITAIVYTMVKSYRMHTSSSRSKFELCASTDLPSLVAISSTVDNESDELFWKGYIDLHRERYILECVSAESDIDLTINQ
ncbi:4726_t:CDS:2, partial [Scutellospora calospora]